MRAVSSGCRPRPTRATARVAPTGGFPATSVGAIHESPAEAFPLRGRWPVGPDEARRMRCSPVFRPCPTNGPSGTPAPTDAARNIAAISGGERLPCVRGAVERSETEGLPPHLRLPTVSNPRAVGDAGPYGGVPGCLKGYRPATSSLFTITSYFYIVSGKKL